jgi:hypothetical protein
LSSKAESIAIQNDGQDTDTKLSQAIAQAMRSGIGAFNDEGFIEYLMNTKS